MALGMELLGGAIGAAVGLAVGYCNMRITKRSVQKHGPGGVMATNAVRMLINFLLLLVIWLVRNVSPLGFIGTLIGAAVGLSVGNMYFIVKLSRELSESYDAAAESAQESGGDSGEN